jgi:hypothetical protein
MTYGYGPANTKSAYLPTEFQLPTDEKEAQEFVANRERLTASILNVKRNGQFEKQELLSGEQWFTTPSGTTSNQQNRQRYGFLQAFDLIQLAEEQTNQSFIAAGTTTSFVHNIDMTKFTAILRVYGGAITNEPRYLSLPYPAQTANRTIELYFDSTTITITVGNAHSELLQAFCVVEYLKQP